MPPHCDSLDGPVAVAAKRAIEARDPDLLLPYVKADGEAEVLAAYERAVAARNGNPAANELAELYLCETAVRVHRAGEGAPYTGLKPAGLGFGPVVPVAEAALASGSPDDLVRLLTDKVRDETLARFAHAMALKPHAGDGVASARAYVEASLGLQVWSHSLYERASSHPHEEEDAAHAHAA